MRIGPDVAPSWHVDQPVVIPGLGGTHPSTRNGVRNTLARAFMHRRLWLNDPDCLMVRATDTKLTRAEATTLAAAIAVTGGMVIFSDDVPVLDDAGRALVRDTTALSREADAGAARVLDVMGAEIATGAVARNGDSVLLALVNGSDAPRRAALDLRTLGVPLCTTPLTRVLGGAAPAITADGVLEAELGAHESVVVRLPAAPPLAVFCDFDGTFAVQDVGSTLAKRYAAERRPAQLERLARGEIIPWEYNLEILDRLPVSEAATDAFLRTVELDPGARALIGFCATHGLPFRILSDGFDRNLDALQRIHGVRFEYDANRLWFEDDRWRIAAVHLNPSCGCGTGNCKRSRIGIYRAAHPGTRTVHIGNGRVSDKCGALAADLAFAKGTLADVLTEDGAPFEPFETLHDVVRVLERELGRAGSGG
jgi:2-hydroxy-3-keto-5-methylthiopentenyl-1-phosphate phosphatase